MCEYVLRAALAGEGPALRPLWQACFGDGQDFAACYEGGMFRPERVELALLDGGAVSMLTVLPAALTTPAGTTVPAGCVYGVATLPAHQGRGLATRLLDQALRRRLGRGMDCLAVVPDTPDLFGYYGRTMGAETAFYVREIRLAAEDLGDLSPLAPAATDPETYCALRRQALRGRTYLDWDREAVAFQQAICRMEGGDLYHFPGAPGCCAAAQMGEDGELAVCELLAPEERLGPCLLGLLAAAGCRTVLVRLPAWSGGALGGEVTPFAMLAGRTLPPEDQAYLGFDFA